MHIYHYRACHARRYACACFAYALKTVPSEWRLELGSDAATMLVTTAYTSFRILSVRPHLPRSAVGRPPGGFQRSARRAGKPASPRRIDSLRRRRQRGVGPESKSKKNWDARDEDDAVVVKLGVWQARGALGVNRDLRITSHIRKVALCSVTSAP